MLHIINILKINKEYLKCIPKFMLNSNLFEYTTVVIQADFTNFLSIFLHTIIGLVSKALPFTVLGFLLPNFKVIAISVFSTSAYAFACLSRNGYTEDTWCLKLFGSLVKSPPILPRSTSCLYPDSSFVLLFSILNRFFM